MILPKADTAGKKRRFLVLIILVIAFFTAKFFFMPRARHQLYKHNPSTFFSLFLSNDQVYFGRIVEETSDTIVLKDVYYLKTTSSDLTTQTNLNEGTVSAKLSLVKLGKELHRPKDQIFINRQHVIYYEEMGDESPIIENILNSRKQKL